MTSPRSRLPPALPRSDPPARAGAPSSAWPPALLEEMGNFPSNFLWIRLPGCRSPTAPQGGWAEAALLAHQDSSTPARTAPFSRAPNPWGKKKELKNLRLHPRGMWRMGEGAGGWETLNAAGKSSGSRHGPALCPARAPCPPQGRWAQPGRGADATGCSWPDTGATFTGGHGQRRACEMGDPTPTLSWVRAARWGRQSGN